MLKALSMFNPKHFLWKTKPYFYFLFISANTSSQYRLISSSCRDLADGWFLFVKPLPIGEHKIHVAGTIDAPDPNCNSNGDVTWVIRVK